MHDTKPSKLKRFVPLIIFISLVVVLAIGLRKNPRLVPSPLIGKPAPVFTLPLLNKPGTFSTKDFIGKVTLLNVWASWCFVCREENETVKQLSRQGYRVIGYNYKDKPKDAKAWLRQLGNPYKEIVSDIKGRVAIDWGVYGAPETFLIDRKGIIRYKVIGSLSEPKALHKLLEKIKELN